MPCAHADRSLLRDLATRIAEIAADPVMAPRGLEEGMLDMYAEPQMLHDAMAFLEEGHHRILRQYFAQNLLAFNNDNT